MLLKHMCIASGTGTVKCIVEPDRNHGLKLTAEANILHYGEVEDRQMQIDRPIKVEHEDIERKAHAWR